MPVTSLPVCERIADLVFQRVQTLEADYSPFTEVPYVVRTTATDIGTPTHNSIVITADQPVPVPELSYPGNPPSTAYDMAVHINCRVMPGEVTTVPLDRYRNYIASDVIRVVCKPANSWHNWNGLAINSRLLTIDAVPISEDTGGVRVSFVITYRTDEGNPYNVRG